MGRKQGNSPLYGRCGRHRSHGGAPRWDQSHLSTTRIHPAIVAHAAAAAASMLPGRFSSGGRRREPERHILGGPLDRDRVRQERLEEAIEVIRLLWQGGLPEPPGKHYTVANARVFALPDEPPPIIVRRRGPPGDGDGGKIRRRVLRPRPRLERDRAGRAGRRQGKPRFGQLHVCWAATRGGGNEDQARVVADAVVSGDLNWDCRCRPTSRTPRRGPTRTRLPTATSAGPDQAAPWRGSASSSTPATTTSTSIRWPRPGPGVPPLRRVRAPAAGCDNRPGFR